MAHELFKRHKFSAGTEDVISKASVILHEYERLGIRLTLRQLYYQFVARGYIANTQRDYKRIGDVINNARLAGLIDWSAIEDRTRSLEENSHWESPESIIKSASQSYAIDKWENQQYRVEAWIEKEALASVIEGVCIESDIPYFCCRGYVSQSEMYRAGKRLRGYIDEFDQYPIILHMGDHDPSGIDMTRDIRERLSMFVREDITVERIALNMEQIEMFSPPPNPAKITDTRAKSYMAKYGNKSWELDAMEPTELIEIIKGELATYRDDDMFRNAQILEESEKKVLSGISDKYSDVVAFINK